MARDGSITRDRILGTAMELALRQGHVATSIDEIIKAADINKGTFFYHFPSKKDLAIALIEKFSAIEMQILEENMAKANKLSKDPLQQLLIFVGLIQELHAELEEGQVGCLYASYSYENQFKDEDLQAMAMDTLGEWKVRLSEKIQEIMKKYPPRFKIDPDELADMFIVTLEGAYVITRIKNQHDAVEKHLDLYKTYLESLFKPH
jgi:TetR/AcrR family transcriptional repressor of nem operon